MCRGLLSGAAAEDEMTASPVQLRDFALDLAREGVLLARQMRPGVEVTETKTSAVDVVTQADRAVEDLLRRRILSDRPGDGILGEEGDEVSSSTGVRWIIDPIDGTVNYLYGLPECAVSVAAELDGQVVAGVVAGIGVPTEYAAALGSGATRDGVAMRVRETPALAQRLVLTGFGYRPEVRAHQGACVAALLPKVRDIRRMGSCALDLCHVAEGTADAYVEVGPQPWDWAAGGLVLSESGGRFELLSGALVPDGPPGDRVLTGTPAGGWGTFVEAIGESGFLA